MIETRRLKNVVIFIQTILSFVLSKKIISDHHYLIYSMLETTFEKAESKTVTYRKYKQFKRKTFEKDLTNSLRNCNGSMKIMTKISLRCFTRMPRKN